MNDPEKNKHCFIGDRPLSDAPTFKFSQIADTLYRFIVNPSAPTPFTVCISGGWGTGKTTLLKNVEQRLLLAKNLKESRDVPVRFKPVWFEPWKLSGEEQVRDALAKRLLSIIEQDADFISRAEIEVDRRNIVRMLSSRLFKVDPNEVSAYYNWDARLKGSFVELEELFKKIAKAFLDDTNEPRRFVVFIDDLDRCPPDRVVEVLEAMKLFFDFEGMSFIFALDLEQTERAVMQQYNWMSLNDARTYLEKMFQLTYRLPHKEPDGLISFLTSTMEEVGLSIKNRTTAEAIIDRFGRNLRNLKLFVNAFNFQKRVVDRIGTGISDELIFKWLYLETTMPATLAVANQYRTFNPIIALEFLSIGGALYDDNLRLKYINRLRETGLIDLALLVYSMVGEPDDDSPVRKVGLTSKQMALVNAFKLDGGIDETLRLMSAGEPYLIDQNLQHIVHLTQNESISSSEKDPIIAPMHIDPSLFDEYTVVSPKCWKNSGEFYRERSDFRSASLCFLMALLHEPNKDYRIRDMSEALRNLGFINASKALLKIIYEHWPKSIHLASEASYLYAITMGDHEVGSLLYRKAIICGTTVASPAHNLRAIYENKGDFNSAYLCALEAFSKESNDEKRIHLERLASITNRTERDFSGWNQSLAIELQEAYQKQESPFFLTGDEEQRVHALYQSHPSLQEASDELRSFIVHS